MVHNSNELAEKNISYPHPGDKYKGEADGIAKLLETDPAAAAKRLQLDSHMKPHEFHTLLKAIQTTYAGDKSSNASLPNIIFSDNKDGIKIGVENPKSREIPIVFEMKASELNTQNDKPIPQTGELLGLNPEQTKQILDIQKKEKSENGGKSHKFGDIAVSLGYKTPDEVNAALIKQDHIRAAQLADDLSKAMPLGKDEGYFQMLRRTRPELSDETAVKVAHQIKQLNHNHSVLIVGSELPTMNRVQRKEAEETLYADIHKRTGSATAKIGQPLSEIPLN